MPDSTIAATAATAAIADTADTSPYSAADPLPPTLDIKYRFLLNPVSTGGALTGGSGIHTVSPPAPDTFETASPVPSNVGDLIGATSAARISGNEGTGRSGYFLCRFTLTPNQANNAKGHRKTKALMDAVEQMATDTYVEATVSMEAYRITPADLSAIPEAALEFGMRRSFVDVLKDVASHLPVVAGMTVKIGKDTKGTEEPSRSTFTRSRDGDKASWDVSVRMGDPREIGGAAFEFDQTALKTLSDHTARVAGTYGTDLGVTEVGVPTGKV